MPIYSYLCSACGAAKDVLQKLSDLPLVICPNCGRQTFSKQLTAAGFVLKGSGWYATDFKNQKKTVTKAIINNLEVCACIYAVSNWL